MVTPEVFTRAVTRGKTRNLDSILKAVLAELQQEIEADRRTNHIQRSLDDPLTARELEILRLIADGISTEQVAQKLYLSVQTIRWYLKQIYGKLDVHGRVEAIVRARELHLIP
jgi:ATP/maltotriose-dependent transcriptional regulator MalT